MNKILGAILISAINAVPLKYVQNVAEYDGPVENFDNYLPRVGDYPKFEYSTFSDDKDDNREIPPSKTLDIEFKSISHNNTKILNEFMDLIKNSETFNSVKHIISTLATSKSEENASLPNSYDNDTVITTTLQSTETNTILDDDSLKESTTSIPSHDTNIDPVLQNSTDISSAIRPIRQEIEDSSESSNEDSDDNSDEENDGNMITGILSAFLSGLSKPDGTVDIEAITNILGSLSTQNPDGTYEFSGLTQLLKNFFGGGGEDGGGSNFGAFIAGLLGGFLQGVAEPPGGRGVGVFLANLVGGLIPSLSAPPPPEEGAAPQQGLDSGGFLSGFLKTFLGSSGSLSGGSSGSSNGTSGDPGASKGGGSKFQIFKALFSIVTSILGASSGSSSK